MKKFILSTLFGVAFLISGTLSFNISNAEAQSLSLSLSDKIVCHCTFVSLKCKASGSSGVCAQSEEGGNIFCSNYNSNC